MLYFSEGEKIVQLTLWWVWVSPVFRPEFGRAVAVVRRHCSLPSSCPLLHTRVVLLTLLVLLTACHSIRGDGSWSWLGSNGGWGAWGRVWSSLWMVVVVVLLLQQVGRAVTASLTHIHCWIWILYHRTYTWLNYTTSILFFHILIKQDNVGFIYYV